jgi:hypothetical protein
VRERRGDLGRATVSDVQYEVSDLMPADRSFLVNLARRDRGAALLEMQQFVLFEFQEPNNTQPVPVVEDQILDSAIIDDTTAYDRSFNTSILRVVHRRFSSIVAVGHATTDGLGATVSLINSQLTIIDANFTAGVALLGGAIGGLNTNVIARDSNFVRCAVYFLGCPAGFKCLTFLNVQQEDHVLLFHNCMFQVAFRERLRRTFP